MNPELTSTKTYVYCEDDLLSRQAMDLILKRVMRAENVHIFEDSADFMSRLVALPTAPDVVLLDIHMKPHTGFDLLRMLRSDQHYQQTRVIALTASVMNEEVKTLMESGFDGVIGKPISVATFPRIIERVLAGESVWHITY